MSGGPVFVAAESVVAHGARAGLVVAERSRPPLVVVAGGRHPAAVVEARASMLVAERERASVVYAGRPVSSMVIAAGAQGPAGLPGAGATNDIEIPFAWGDATPKLLGHVEGVVIAASLVLVAAFNGTGAALTIGTLADPDLLLRADQNLPAEAGRYESNPAVELDADVYLFITPGLGSSQGSGVAFLEIAS